MNSFKMIWMQLNSTQLIDLKMKTDFYKIEILCLCKNLPLIMNHRKDLKCCLINIKIDKSCRAIDDRMKKNWVLNKIWLKLCRDNSKFNFILTILKTYKHETILIVSYFSIIFMYVKRVNRYFIVILCS